LPVGLSFTEIGRISDNPSSAAGCNKCRTANPLVGPGESAMLDHLERQQKFTRNQWKIFAAATIGDMLDFFDFLLISFILAFIVRTGT
jgi:hypothetical protein